MKFLWWIKLNIWLQFRDRIQTTGYLIGLTFQSWVLSFSIYSFSGPDSDRMQLAVRYSSFMILSLQLMASISILSNEFRYKTFSNIILGSKNIIELLFIRSFANSVIAIPAFAMPLITAFLCTNYSLIETSNFIFALIIGSFLMSLFIAVICNMSKIPGRYATWVYYFCVFFLIASSPFVIFRKISKYFIFGYLTSHIGEGSGLWDLNKGILLQFVVYSSLSFTLSQFTQKKFNALSETGPLLTL